MHLANGQVTPMCAVYGAGIAVLGACVGLAAARAARRPDALKFAAATGFVFAMQAFNVPVLPGVSGHLIGGMLLAYWFGSGLGFAAMSMVLLVQSLLLGDGGLSTLGLNVLNMAIVPCLVVYPIWKRLAGNSHGAMRWASLGVAAYASTLLAAIACTIELGSLAALKPMLLTHGAIGLIEVTITLAAIAVCDRASERLAPVGVGLAMVAAAFGSSPWPDGLEYSASIARLSENVSGWIGQVASLQSMTTSLLSGTAALLIGATLASAGAWVMGRVARVRG
ncbi:MAG: energy-coupling factor ABC transporter permease [Tepidisphaeraceae bacterium]